MTETEIRADERERCARVVERLMDGSSSGEWGGNHNNYLASAAATIRRMRSPKSRSQ